ncbi:hypothetical protein OAZ88_01110, partial [bacterium]|nr:hypothetical protein [bacterium]
QAGALQAAHQPGTADHPGNGDATEQRQQPGGGGAALAGFAWLDCWFVHSHIHRHQVRLAWSGDRLAVEHVVHHLLSTQVPMGT